MDMGAPGLSVEMRIDNTPLETDAAQTIGVFDGVVENVVDAMAKAQSAVSGLDLASGIAKVSVVGPAATRDIAALGREATKVETSIEKTVRALERETLAVGRSREEQRAWKIEQLEARAVLTGNTDGIERLRASLGALVARETEVAAAAAREAQALREAAQAHSLFEAAASKGIAAMRQQEAALQADAAAAEALRRATDPLYAATQRLNDEIAESTRLYHAGATAPGEYARQQDVLAGRLREVTREHHVVAGAAGNNAFALKQVAVQLPDVIQGLLSGQAPMQIFIQQGGQIAQTAQMAEGGIAGFGRSLFALLLPFAPLIAILAVAAGGFALFSREVSKGVDTKGIIDGLGLTRAEIKRLENTSVSTGDVIKATFQVMAKNVGLDLSKLTGWFGDAMDFLTRVGRDTLAGLYAGFVGTFDAIAIITQGLRDGKGINAIAGDVGKNVSKRFEEARGALNRFGDDVTKQIGSNKLADLTKQANAIKLDRGAGKTDRHAEQLARESEAIEAQIRNLYKLADAYGVSGAAALIAEARVKAESAAIKQRGDIEAAVARQVRLAVAQRVADAAKGTAGMRDQAAMQEQVNALVAAGNVPAARAAELMADRIADLPLLAALEVAHGKDAAAVADALDKQRAARVRLTEAEAEARRVSAIDKGRLRLAELAEELRLAGAADDVRVRGLATLKAMQEAQANGWSGSKGAEYIAQQTEIADSQLQVQIVINAINESLRYQGDLLDAIASNAQAAGQGLAEAFGTAGRALGDLASTFARFVADQHHLVEARDEQLAQARLIKDEELRAQRERQIGTQFAIRSSQAQIGLFGDLASSAKGFFKEGTSGYAALQKAEQVFRAIQFALSVRAMAQDAIETGAAIANSVARTAKFAVEAVVNAIKSLPFPLNLVAGAATAAALVGLGLSIAGSFGGSTKQTPANEGTGTVLGDTKAKSDSIKNALDALKDVNLITNSYSRQMAESLKSIDSQIGGLASVLVRGGEISANDLVKTGFKPNGIGAIFGAIPLIGGFLSSLFGTRTDVIGNGLYGAPQSIGSIRDSGFNAQAYSDVQKTSKFLGIVTGRRNSTVYGAVDPALADQFTLILKSFNDAIVAAAGPLGAATSEIQDRLNGFVVNIGKIDLKGLTGEQIQEKLNAIFGAAADDLAKAAFPDIQQFQKVGEGAFETLVRVASTIESVTTSLDLLGGAAQNLGVAAKLGLADQFDSVSALSSAVESYFQGFYTREEQAAAKTAQLAKVFDSLNLTVPTSLDGFRKLVEAQDLTTAAGQSTYATLLQLAPAFAELQSSLSGAKSAADILSERSDLQRQLLELAGDTAALRALDLAKVDASNRALQQQVYAVQDAQEAAKAAKALSDAWSSVGDSISAEINRIRGLSDTGTAGSFASLLGQFNAASIAARGGDMEAAKSLPGLSQSLLSAAALAATSRQELDRVQAQTASSLEETNAAIRAISGGTAPSAAATIDAAAQASSANTAPTAANDEMAIEIRALRDEMAAMRSENNAGHAATAGNTGSMKRTLDNVTAASGGEAITVAVAA